MRRRRSDAVLLSRPVPHREPPANLVLPKEAGETRAGMAPRIWEQVCLSGVERTSHRRKRAEFRASRQRPDQKENLNNINGLVWLCVQSSANPSRLRQAKNFPANREKNREFHDFRRLRPCVVAGEPGKSSLSQSNSLRRRTGNFEWHISECEISIRQLCPPGVAVGRFGASA